MPPIEPETDDQKRRYEEAKARRISRLELKKQNEERRKQRAGEQE
jgi:hypothetical protein